MPTQLTLTTHVLTVDRNRKWRRSRIIIIRGNVDDDVVAIEWAVEMNDTSVHLHFEHKKIGQQIGRGSVFGLQIATFRPFRRMAMLVSGFDPWHRWGVIDGPVEWGENDSAPVVRLKNCAG